VELPRSAPSALPDDGWVQDRLVVATEAIADGRVTRRELERRYVKIHRNVYAPIGVELTARDRVMAAWLWSGRTATLVGHSAAVQLGSKWIPADAPVELAHSRRPASRGITVHSDELATDELAVVSGITHTTAARTAYDLGRWLPPQMGVIRVDALLNATGCAVSDVARIADRYPGARSVRRLRHVLANVDGGSESPQETRLRLLLMRGGLPRPTTQIPVTNQWGRVVRRIDMGWRQWQVGVEYDGEQHWKDPRQHADDIERLEFLALAGWLIVRVSATQLRWQQPAVVERARVALQRRGFEG
jgi:very-short-patch-repair endonuclease